MKRKRSCYASVYDTAYLQRDRMAYLLQQIDACMRFPSRFAFLPLHLQTLVETQSICEPFVECVSGRIRRCVSISLFVQNRAARRIQRAFYVPGGIWVRTVLSKIRRQDWLVPPKKESHFPSPKNGCLH